MTNDGILTIYNLRDVSAPGTMPDLRLVKIGTAYYSQRTVGVTRLYAAAAANRKIDKLVRCHFTTLPVTGQYVILEDGFQYRIDAMQEITGTDDCDLTLVRLEELYDLDI